jgi:type IX secretion system substrate protein
MKGTTGAYSVIVTNLKGKILWKAEDVRDNNINLPLTNLAAGIYIITVSDKQHTGRLKLVKQSRTAY